MVLTNNKANPGLFDVSIAASVEEYDVTEKDMITCEIKIPGTDFNILIETKMFGKTRDTLCMNIIEYYIRGNRKRKSEFRV